MRATRPPTLEEVRAARAALSGLAVRTPLLPAMHGDSSGVRGAAWLGRTRALSPPG